MKLYILLKNGQPINHPILEHNFIENYNVLKNFDFAEFVRKGKPVLGPYEKYEGLEYRWNGNVVEDFHVITPMNEQERIEQQIKVKEKWIEIGGQSSWIFSEELCKYVPPKPYPEDGNQYFWDDQSNNWIEVSIILNQNNNGIS